MKHIEVVAAIIQHEGKTLCVLKSFYVYLYSKMLLISTWTKFVQCGLNC